MLFDDHKRAPFRLLFALWVQPKLRRMGRSEDGGTIWETGSRPKYRGVLVVMRSPSRSSSTLGSLSLRADRACRVEVGPVSPHGEQDAGQLACKSNGGAPFASAFCDAVGPGLQSRVLRRL
jgi:hypothetical protein